MCHKICLSILFCNMLLCLHVVKAQETFQMYMAEFNNGMGMVYYKPELKQNPPMSLYPYLLVTGLNFSSCNENGLPELNAYELNIEASDKIEKTIGSKTPFMKAGRLMIHCEHRIYCYVKDTQGLTAKLVEFYNKKYPGKPYYLQLKEDKQWETYNKFLYPSPEILNANNNAKQLLELKQAGDSLNIPREVSFKASFYRPIERDSFVRKIVLDGYNIEAIQKTKNKNFPYQVTFTKVMGLSEEKINEITEKMLTDLKNLVGELEGWSCEVTSK